MMMALESKLGISPNKSQTKHNPEIEMLKKVVLVKILQSQG
jgi:hypothetical protein